MRPSCGRQATAPVNSRREVLEERKPTPRRDDPLGYRLPISFVRITGTQKTITTDLDIDQRRVDRQGVIEMDVVADPASRCELSPPDGAGWESRQITLALLPDSRLATLGAETIDERGSRLKAVVSLGGGLAGLTRGSPETSRGGRR